MKKYLVSITAAVLSGLIVLLGYLLPRLSLLQTLRSTLVNWAVILFGVAMIIGVFNLLAVHWRKLTRDEGRDPYSFVLLATFIMTVVFGLLMSPSDLRFQKIILSVMRPIQISLVAVLTFGLAAAGIKTAWPESQPHVGLFSISTVLFLFFNTDLGMTLTHLPFFDGLVPFIKTIPLAGARGMIIGISLGSILTGLRIVLGMERPYTG